MTIKHIFYTLLGGALTLAAASCTNKKFNIQGTIANAADSVLFLENNSLDGPVKVDSVKLTADGTFEFTVDYKDEPEFLRLRIAGQIINLAIDSTETVTVTSQYPNMAANYTVEGSEECKTIQQLAYKQIALQQKAIEIQQNPGLSVQRSADSILALVNEYKEQIKHDYIYKSPNRLSSYFALFQAIGNQLIFNPRNSEEDIKVFGAVATSWDVRYPNSLRGENLHNITIEGMKNIRILQNRRANAQSTLATAEEATLIDIALTDNQGHERKLTDLKGKVVMLDFHVFASDQSTARIMQMRDLYNKYQAKGFEIYQISIDTDQHFWKSKTAALPWISVNDPESVNSRNLVLYNVQSIPTFFLINRNNELVKRDVQIKDIDKEIQSLL